MNVVTRQVSPRTATPITQMHLGMLDELCDNGDIRLCTAPRYEGATVDKRYSRSWNGVVATLDAVSSHDEYRALFDNSKTTLVVVLEEVGGALVLHDGNSPLRHGGHPTKRGPISLLASGHTVDAAGRDLRHLRLLVLRLDPVLPLEEPRPPELSAAITMTRLSFSDPDVMRLAELIADELRAPGLNDEIYLESLTTALLVALTRLERRRMKPRYVRGGLSPTHLRRAQELMLHEDAQPLKLQDIAKELHISQAHLSRAFKTSTGQAPHQWLIERKIERAKTLLIDGGIALSAIALKLGFCDQAHFTRAFRKRTGMTPLSWQRL